MIASIRGKSRRGARPCRHRGVRRGLPGQRDAVDAVHLAPRHQARLVTAMIVREDSMTLYGFADSDARDLFSTLLSVSGVGPKIALATLAVHDAPALRRALADTDVAALTRVPGSASAAPNGWC